MLDQHNLTIDQAMRVGKTAVVGQLLGRIAELAYTMAGSDEPEHDVPWGEYTLRWRLRPTPRIQIHGLAEVFGEQQESLVSVFDALGYEVRNKGDHLVIIL